MFPRRGKIDPDTLAAWKREQTELAGRMRIEPLGELPRIVAGADCAFIETEVIAAAVRYDREAQEVVETVSVRRPLDVPYIPGYLSFREAPAVLAALGRLTGDWAAVLIDGAGVAHPRRCGLAVHVGVTLGRPAVGVAKSRLIGTHADPGPRSGDAAELTHDGETIGTVLRTRDRTRPLFVSVGHRVSLSDAVRLTLACRTRYRLPEPTRRADRAVAAAKAHAVA